MPTDDLTLPLWDAPHAVVQSPATRTHPAAPLVVPVPYQGGKQRLASAIADLWWPTDGTPPGRFVELCCGSGAASVEMVNRGYPVEAITMVDAGPWGLFWQAVGAGTFSTDVFEAHLDALPADPTLIQPALQELARQPVRTDAAEVFPILQAGSFGAKAITITHPAAHPAAHSGTRSDPDAATGARWSHSGFRSYWLPTATSSRRSPVNPMMPMPDTLRSRVLAVVEAMRGIDGKRADVTTIAGDLSPAPAGDINGADATVVYMDPPYAGTTAYGYGLDIPAVAHAATAAGTVYVSEGVALTDEAHLLSAGRTKGGISGAKKVAHNQEWVSVFRA